MNRSAHHQGGHSATQGGGVMDNFKEAAESAAEGVRQAAGQIQDTAGSLQDGVWHSIEYGRQQSRQLKKDLGKAVAANPVKALLIAAGAGLLVGMWMKRR